MNEGARPAAGASLLTAGEALPSMMNTWTTAPARALTTGTCPTRGAEGTAEACMQSLHYLIVPY